VVKATLMRATLHLVSAREYPLLAAAVREAQISLRTRGVEPPPAAAVARALALAREGPVTRRDLYRVLGYDRAPDPAMDVRPLRELHWLIALADLVQSPAAAMWAPARITTFRALDLDLAPPDKGRSHLVRRYLTAYGPASRADLAQWSGVPLRELAPALDSLRLRTYRDEAGRELLDLPRAPIASGTEPAPARLLPRWDEVLLAYDRRERILPEAYRRRVIAKNGDVAETFLVDGFVAGLWQLERGRVVLEPFERLPLRARRELADEARRLEAFVR